MDRGYVYNLAAMSATHIVCPTDFHPESTRGFYHALALALAEQARLTALHVGTESRHEVAWHRYPRVRDILVRWGMLDSGTPRAAISEQLLIGVRKMAMRDEEAAQGILDFVAENRTDLLVMATRAPSGWSRLWQGSTALRVLRCACTDILLLPGGSRDLVDPDTGTPRLQRVLLPIAANPDARAAITAVSALLPKIASGDLHVTVLHVGAERTAPRYDLPATAGIEWHPTQRTGDVTDRIVSEAERIDADLIAMATAGRRRLADELSGNRVEQVLRRARRPLLAVPSE